MFKIGPEDVQDPDLPKQSGNTCFQRIQKLVHDPLNLSFIFLKLLFIMSFCSLCDRWGCPTLVKFSFAQNWHWNKFIIYIYAWNFEQFFFYSITIFVSDIISLRAMRSHSVLSISGCLWLVFLHWAWQPSDRQNKHLAWTEISPMNGKVGNETQKASL